MIKINNKKYIKKIILILISILFIVSTYAFYKISIIKKERGFVYGKHNAPIIIEEYSSFECGSCRDFHMQNGEILKEYIELGIVKYILKPVDIERFEYDDYIYTYLSNNKIKDLKYVDRIFKTQDEWANFNNKEQVKKFLNLKSKPNIIYNEGFIWKKDELLEQDISIVPHVKVNNEVVSSKISKQELRDKIESLIK